MERPALEDATMRRNDLTRLRSSAAARGMRTTREGRGAAMARLRAALAETAS